VSAKDLKYFEFQFEIYEARDDFQYLKDFLQISSPANFSK